MEAKIELREIIEIIIKGKWIIALVLLISIIFSSVLSWFVIDEKYESNAIIQIVNTEQNVGILESLIAKEFTTEVFLQRVQNLEKNKKKLSATIEGNSSLITLKYFDNSSQEAQRSLQKIINTTTAEMDTSVQKTLSDYEDSLLIQAEVLSNEIEKLMNEYNNLIHSNNLPEVLILQTVSSSQFVLELTSEQTNSLKKIDGKIQNQLLQLKAQIDAKSNEYGQALEKYESLNKGLESFTPNLFVRVIQEPTLPEAPSSKLINLAIGSVFGIILGIGIVFFRYYWKNSEPVKK